jgi:hypothetical protein
MHPNSTEWLSEPEGVRSEMRSRHLAAETGSDELSEDHKQECET